MAEIIKDGRTGDTAKVDIYNRIHTQALTVTVTQHAHLQSNAYDVSTGGLINLGDAVNAPLIYVSNTGDSDLIVETIFIDSTASTGGAGSGSLTWHLNPNAGTLVSAATAAQVLSRRIGSPVNLSSDSYKAATEGLTLTGGSAITFPVSAGVGIPFAKPFVIPKGQAFGVSYTAPAGNTDMDIQVGLLILVDATSTV
jgi:hypothetical protein